MAQHCKLQGSGLGLAPHRPKPCIHAPALAPVGLISCRQSAVNPHHHHYVMSRQHSLVVHARRRQQGWDSRSNRDSRSDDHAFRFKFNQIDVTLAEDQLWRLALPFAALFGLAIFIGPLVVGLTLSAIAIGAAFSAGALAFTTLLLPFIVMTSLGGLLSFGLFAGLGFAFVLPKMIFSALSLAFVGGGLLLGWGGVNWLLNQQSSAQGVNASNSSSNTIEAEEDEEERLRQRQQQEQRRINSELRQFDELLEAKDQQRQRQQRW